MAKTRQGGKTPVKPKILVTIPSIVVANAFFVQSRAFQDLTDDFDIYICCYTGNLKGVDVNIFNGMGFCGIYGYEDSSRRRKIYPWQLQINTLGGRKYSRSCGVIYDMNQRAYGNLRQRMIHRTLGASSSSARFMNYIFEKYSGENDSLKKIIEAIKPDLMITFLSGNSTVEIESIKSAHLHGIPIAGIQYGIDNLCTRGLMPFLPDYVGVWGYQSRIFAEKMHGIPPERIFHVGAPFSDEFKKPSDRTESEIKTALGLPGGKRVLFYAGSIWAYNEVRHLKLIDDAIEAGELENCCVFYRPHPFQHRVKGDIDFFEQEFKHVYIDPALTEQYKIAKKQNKDFSFDRDKTPIEFTHIKGILEVSSVIIAQISTMMFQGAILGVPSVGILYVDRANEKYWRRWEFEEMSFIRAMPGICLCLNPDGLIADCRKALEWSEDAVIRKAMKNHVCSAIHDDELTYRQRVRHAINAILHRDSDSIYSYLGEPVINIKNRENVIDF